MEQQFADIGSHMVDFGGLVLPGRSTGAEQDTVELHMPAEDSLHKSAGEAEEEYCNHTPLEAGVEADIGAVEGKLVDKLRNCTVVVAGKPSCRTEEAAGGIQGTLEGSEAADEGTVACDCSCSNCRSRSRGVECQTLWSLAVQVLVWGAPRSTAASTTRTLLRPFRGRIS